MNCSFRCTFETVLVGPVPIISGWLTNLLCLLTPPGRSCLFPLAALQSKMHQSVIYWTGATYAALWELYTFSAVNISAKCRNKSGCVFENGWLTLCTGTVLACLRTGTDRTAKVPGLAVRWHIQRHYNSTVESWCNFGLINCSAHKTPSLLFQSCRLHRHKNQSLAETRRINIDSLISSRRKASLHLESNPMESIPV